MEPAVQHLVWTLDSDCNCTNYLDGDGAEETARSRPACPSHEASRLAGPVREFPLACVLRALSAHVDAQRRARIFAESGEHARPGRRSLHGWPDCAHNVAANRTLAPHNTYYGEGDTR